MSIANRDQAEHWNSDEQADRWVSRQDAYDRMLAPFATMILGAASLASSDHVLDVGCGCGATTLAASRAVAPGTATGIDLSAPMLARARQNAAAAGIGNAHFLQADAQVHPFRQVFDAVISRFGVMFFADPVAAFANLHMAARPGGRLTFVCWQPLVANEWLTVPAAALAEHLPIPDLGDPAAPGMFGLAEPDRIRSILAATRWQNVSVRPEHVPILVGGGTLDDAVTFLRTGQLGRRILDGADAATQARAVQSVRAALAQHADNGGVRLGAAVWLVQAEA